MNIQVKPNENIDVSKLLIFFELLYKEKNASQEEVYNFSIECLKYVFKLQNIDLKKYNINIHFKKLNNEEDGRSYCEQSAKDKNTFDVVMNKEDLTFHLSPLSNAVYYDEAKSRNINKNEFHNPRLEYHKSLTNFCYFLNTLLHEYAHIVQYVKCPNLIGKSDMDRYLTGESIKKHLATIEDKNEKKLLIKQFITHYNNKDFIRLIEKDANRQAFAYTKVLLKHLINEAKDNDFKWFLYNLLKTSKQIRQEDFVDYRIFNKHNKFTLQILNEHNVPEDCILCF